MASIVGTSAAAPVLWFTGLSGSGKSTIAVRVHEMLVQKQVEVEYIDGDALRDVFPNTGFTRPEREDHLRRTGYMASRLAAHGVTVVASFVSPYSDSRNFIRSFSIRIRSNKREQTIKRCSKRFPDRSKVDMA